MFKYSKLKIGDLTEKRDEYITLVWWKFELCEYDGFFCTVYGNSSEDLGSGVDHSKDISTALWVNVDNGYKGIHVINF